jgi:putative ATP-dependent endonuclease of OLD family
MKLKSFYVKNYRSLVEANLKDLNNFCAIVGPNNTGKSNLLRAIMTALSIALNGDFKAVRRRNQFSYLYAGKDFDWTRDIPKSALNDTNASTVFKLTFDFSEADKTEFYDKFKIRLSKSLQMKFELYKNSTEYNIVMPGRAKAPMNARMEEIGLFVREKLDYQYIPCVRTTELTSNYFQHMIEREFDRLYENEEYVGHINRIKQLQEPLLQELEHKMLEMLKTFVPNIMNVKIPNDIVENNTNTKYYPVHRFPIQINDGNETTLEEKGDGVKSLVAIGLMESISFENAKGKELVLCIEEPESHLHPDAIHSLKNVLTEISKKSNVQVIISTHSPLLVDKDNPKNNILVEMNRRISNCTSISQVRELLGVRVNDNLIGARKVILVEGLSDRRYLCKLLGDKFQQFRLMHDNKEIEIVNVHSASKMDYQIRLYNSFVVPSIAILDNDESGQEAYRSLVNSKIKMPGEVLLIKSVGMQLNELEDILDLNCYKDEIYNEFGINLNTREFKKRNKKWSDRVKREVCKSPLLWDDNLQNQLKEKLADIVERIGYKAIAPYDLEVVENIIMIIGKYLGL